MILKYVINSCYGGFGLSHEAIKRYADIKGLAYTVERIHGDLQVVFEDDFYVLGIDRSDPILVQVVAEMGSEAASGKHSNLKIVEIDVDSLIQIEEYDGIERLVVGSVNYR